jgi:hypothetical protein
MEWSIKNKGKEMRKGKKLNFKDIKVGMKVISEDMIEDNDENYNIDYAIVKEVVNIHDIVITYINKDGKWAGQGLVCMKKGCHEDRFGVDDKGRKFK